VTPVKVARPGAAEHRSIGASEHLAGVKRDHDGQDAQGRQMRSCLLLNMLTDRGTGPNKLTHRPKLTFEADLLKRQHGVAQS
jgi:hypothetical protein